MDSFQIAISDWAAFSPRRMQRDQWLAWAEGNDGRESGEHKPELPWVSPMLRRRLSPMGRAALWAAGQLLDDQRGEPVATIFASRHGEVGRTVKLMRELAVESPLSPASFSLSVHNAIGGIHSIANQVFSPVTAISAGPDTLSAALLEAYTQLVCAGRGAGVAGEGAEVLCVFYDDSLPDPLGGFNEQEAQVQALALRVTLPGAAEGVPLAFTLSEGPYTSENPSDSGSAQVDSFLRFLLDDEQSNLELRGGKRLWQWCKRDRISA